MCGRVVKVGERVCSPECQQKLDDTVAEKKKAAWKFVAIIAALTVIFALFRTGVI